MAQNFEKRVLQKCPRITFYTYKPVNPFHFLKKHQNRCTLVGILVEKSKSLTSYIILDKFHTWLSFQPCKN